MAVTCCCKVAIDKEDVGFSIAGAIYWSGSRKSRRSKQGKAMILTYFAIKWGGGWKMDW